jgi:hypothetical protein
MNLGPPYSREESEFLEPLAGDLPLKEIVRLFQKHAAEQGWPPRSHRSIQQRLIRMGHEVRVRAGDWVTTGGAGEILGCPGTRVEAWLRRPSTRKILQPVWRGAFRYISRRSWRRLAKEKPQVLGGFSVDRLFDLLEDRELAEQVAARYPRPRGDWRVRCVETGQTWPSAVKAAAELHVSQATITRAMRLARPVAVLGLRFEALREVA